MTSVKSILFNFFTSGKNTGEGEKLTSDLAVRYVILNSVCILGGLFLIVFGIIVLFVEQDLMRALLNFAFSLYTVLIIVLLRTKIPFSIIGTIGVSAFGALCAFFVYAWDINGYESLWLFAFPLLAFFILGIYLGVILSALLFVSILAITLVPGLGGINYTVLMTSRLASSYILVTSLTVIYELIRIRKDRNINELSKKLQVERDEITAMKDSLRIGVFLMDRDLVIQPSYSKSMEEILGTSEIQGKKFTDFLKPSMSKREIDALVDFFQMVINRSFDAKMLEEINPLAQFTYKETDNPYGEEKNLRTSFTAVDRGDEIIMIQGTLDDISNQVRLQNELEAETVKRDEDMKILFQVVQLDPGTFENFLSYTENEFNKVNDFLKNNSLSANADESMNLIFRSVHAIKSDALVLGLDSFGNKLHQLELEIKTMQNRGKVTFEDALHTVTKLEAIMAEKEKYEKTVERISAYRKNQSPPPPVSNKLILVDALKKICEKSAQTEEKNAEFIYDDFNELILDNSSFIKIKEMLTQLVRNAVAHGIEPPNERKALGKNVKGKIRLSVKQTDRQIQMKITDDGAGIDFDKIRKKAISLNLIADNVSDRNTLLKFIFNPGFSTAENTNTTAGQGVGLDLVRDRIKELNGSVKVFSDKGKGTSFNLIIPLN